METPGHVHIEAFATLSVELSQGYITTTTGEGFGDESMLSHGVRSICWRSCDREVANFSAGNAAASAALRRAFDFCSCERRVQGGVVRN